MADPPDSSWIRTYRKVVLRGLAHADAVVAPSHSAIHDVTRNFISPQRQHVIYNGRSPVLFQPHAEKDDYAVSVGRLWDRGKNAALLTRIETPWALYLAGDNNNPDLAVKPTALHLFTGRLIFKGVMTEHQLRQLYAGASIYVATSQYEPFGLAPLEAALSRCALIASDIPSFRELWGDHAIYFRNNDANSLEQALFALCSDREAIKHYGAAALNHARKNYSMARMADQYLELYRSLVPAGAVAA
jgi:glycosyltransferase involved in cell wall biosynthesis